MKIYCKDQNSKFNQHLNFLKTKEVIDYDQAQLKEKTTTITVDTHRNFDQLDLDFLFDYQIFPDNMMSFKTQWAQEKRKMRVNDTIVQQIYLPPNRILSKKIIIGVRINEIIDQSYKKGFSYETLEGHDEKGTSTITVEQLDNSIIFKIHTYSTPGNILTKILEPFFTIPYQKFSTTSALKHVKKQLENNSK